MIYISVGSIYGSDIIEWIETVIIWASNRYLHNCLQIKFLEVDIDQCECKDLDREIRMSRNGISVSRRRQNAICIRVTFRRIGSMLFLYWYFICALSDPIFLKYETDLINTLIISRIIGTNGSCPFFKWRLQLLNPKLPILTGRNWMVIWMPSEHTSRLFRLNTLRMKISLDRDLDPGPLPYQGNALPGWAIKALTTHSMAGSNIRYGHLHKLNCTLS